MRFVATTTLGVEQILHDELAAIGAAELETTRGAVRFTGELEIGYRACLESRTASRVLRVVRQVDARDARKLHAAVRDLPWEEHLDPAGTLAVDVVGTNDALRSARFAAQVVKDGVVDRLRRGPVRPGVDLEDPDLRLHLWLRRTRGTVSIDLGGGSLHRRGWRRELGPAPLKETLAAAILILAGWPEAAAQGLPLVDPMCGSGTLLVEAALIGLDIAPGLLRTAWGFERWRGHDPALWRRLCGTARARRSDRSVALYGNDVAPEAIEATRTNLDAAGVGGVVRLKCAALVDLVAPEGPAGLVVTNPPYAERVGTDDEVARLYPELGDLLRRGFPGWTAHVFTGNPAAARRLGLKPSRRLELFNGPLSCRLITVPIDAKPVIGDGPGWRKR